MKPKLNKGTYSVIAALALLLAACGQSPISNAPIRYDYTVTVQVAASDSQADIEAKYNLPVVIWQPESGYAMLGVQTEQVGGLGSLSGSLDPNKNAFSVAETKASAAAFGLSSWQEGGQAWGGGGQAWGGGGQAWSGGGQAWGGGNGMPSNVTLNANNAVWNRIRLSQALALAPRRGNGIIIAVIDSGIDLSHPAFTNRLVHSSLMWDWVGNDANPSEERGGSNEGFGHGTVVAGIVAQIAQNSRIMPLRVLDSNGKGDTTNVIAAINWAVAKGAKVINLSLGAESEKPLQQALENASKAGVMIVASAGNEGADKLVFPANRGRSGSLGELMLNVGSSDGGDRISAFSNRGKELEILAPGEKVFGPIPNNGMAAWSGTSMAAPMVTGALALALAERSYADLKNLTKALTDNSDDVSANTPSIKPDQLGSGRMNLERFIQASRLLK